MHADLRVRSDAEFDLLALGGLVIRLDPGIVPFRKARAFDIHVAGAEYNVAFNLAECFRLRTAIASAIVDYPIGELVEDRVRAAGVTAFYRRYSHDGVTGPNIATVYSDRGAGVRPPVVFYDRANEAAASLEAGDFDWPAILGRGVRWFHSGGLFAALSGTTPGLMREAMEEARRQGTIVSLDLNYRPRLWAGRGGPGAAQAVLAPLVGLADVLVGNEEDLQLALGIEGPDVTRTGHLGRGAFEQMIEHVTERYPNVRLVATTLRDVRSANRHAWSAVAASKGRLVETPTMELDVVDRVGGGDGFAAGLFFGLLDGRSLEESLRLGWAHGALLTTFPGDTTMAALHEVEALASGGSPRIQR